MGQVYCATRSSKAPTIADRRDEHSILVQTENSSS
jgi:hypothetical protein